MDAVLYITLLVAGFNLWLCSLLYRWKEMDAKEIVLVILGYGIAPYLIAILIDSSLSGNFEFGKSSKAMYALYLASILAMTFYLVKKGFRDRF